MNIKTKRSKTLVLMNKRFGADTVDFAVSATCGRKIFHCGTRVIRFNSVKNRLSAAPYDAISGGLTAGFRFVYVRSELMLMKEGETRIPAGCAISGFINRSGRRTNGSVIVNSIACMHDRSNGLGGGYAGYGIYPEYKDQYAFHVFYDSNEARIKTEAFIDRHFDVINLSRIPTRKHPNITDEPLIWRYFVNPLPTKLQESQLDERTYVARCVIKINDKIDGAYVFSSGKNMGVFKAVGYPEDVGDRKSTRLNSSH